ncbi:Tetraspanin [Mactra antiquata]
MGCFDGLGRVILVAVNVIFLLIGLTVTVLGLVLRFGETLYRPFLETGITYLKDALQDTQLDSFDVDSINISEVLTSLSIGLIVGGIALSLISFFGCFGACSSSNCLLYTYALIVVLFVIGEAVGVGLLYGKPDLIKTPMKSTLYEKFAGLGSSEVFSLTWNIIMIQFKCCGVDNYEDFDSSSTSQWTPVTLGGNTYTLDTPMACCKTLPTSTTLDNCAVRPYDSTLSNSDTGCYQVIWDLSFGNTRIIIPILIVCAIIQIAFIVFAILITKSDDKNAVKPIW